MLAMAALVVLPYGVYIAAATTTDFKGQAGTIDHRADFTSPGFYIDNLQGRAGPLPAAAGLQGSAAGRRPATAGARTSA